MFLWKQFGNLLLTLLIILISIGLLTDQAHTTGKATKSCLTECSSRIGIVSILSDEVDILLAATTDKHSYIINGNTFTNAIPFIAF